MLRILVTAALVAAVCSAATPTVDAHADTGCPAGQTPQFGAGFADLKAQLADWQGEPLAAAV